MKHFTTGNVCFYPAVGGASFADIGEALDEIVSLSMTNNDEEMNEVFSVDSHKDMVISCCWLNIKVHCCAAVLDGLHDREVDWRECINLLQFWVANTAI